METNRPFSTQPFQRNALQWLLRSAMRDLYPRTEHFPGIEDCDDTAFLARFHALSDEKRA